MPGDSELSDAAVVRLVLDGQREAFATLIGRYQDTLYRHAERMTGRADEAADIVQTAFIKGYENLKRCRDPERVGAWLFRIASNQCKDYLKTRRRKSLPLDEAAALADDQEPPDGAAEQREIRDRIRRALQGLAVEQREAFVLKHVEGLSYPEMARLLNVSIPALKMRVHRAREELQGLLEEYR